jgi:hypothetical protein
MNKYADEQSWRLFSSLSTVPPFWTQLGAQRNYTRLTDITIPPREPRNITRVDPTVLALLRRTVPSREAQARQRRPKPFLRTRI